MQPAKILLTSLLMLTLHLPCFASNTEDNEEAAKKAPLQLIPAFPEEVEDKSEGVKQTDEGLILSKKEHNLSLLYDLPLYRGVKVEPIVETLEELRSNFIMDLGE